MVKCLHSSNFKMVRSYSLHFCILLTTCWVPCFATDEPIFYCALYKKVLDPHWATSAHQAMFINLVYKALKQDPNIDRVRVFIKRLLQVCLNGPSQLSSGLLYLVSQLISKRSQLLATTTHYQQVYTEYDEDDEEHYTDAPLPPNDMDPETDVTLNNANATESDEEVEVKMDMEAKKPGWVHCKNIAAKSESKVFDGRARNPAHAGGEFVAYEELTALTHHFHPTVALFAKNILDKQSISYSGDPLQDFTLLRFLERFVFKNPKQLSDGGEGRGPDPCLAQRKRYVATGSKALAITSDSFRLQEEKAVPVDELFLFRYLNKKQPTKKLAVKKEEEDSDVESVGSDEFNEMLDGMVGKMDDDLDFADDVGDKLKSKKKGKNKQPEPESESEDDFSDDDDNGGELNNDEELTDLDEGSDAEAIDFDDDGGDFDGDIDLDNLGSEEDDEFVEDVKPSKSKGNNKARGKGISTMFAPAEKFAEMLEEAGASRMKVGTAHDVSNKDNAALKQLEWESKRNKFAYSGKRKRFSKGGGKQSFNKAKRKKHK